MADTEGKNLTTAQLATAIKLIEEREKEPTSIHYKGGDDG